MRFGDVAILFQSMRRVTLYEDVFKTQELPFLTIAGRGYYDRQEVWDMLDLLKFLHNPPDDLSLATVLRSPMFAFSDDLLFALRLISANDAETDAPLPLWRALRVAATRTVTGMIEGDRPLILYAMETLDGLREISGRVTISELLRLALAKTNYLAIVTGLPDGARRRGNIEKLLQLAQDSGKITLGKFSQYLADLSAREVREGEALLEAGNAVRLMTIHASKGLEFPLVILADASWERGNPGTPILINDPQHGLSCQVYSEETNKLESGFAHRRNLRLAALKEEAERKRLLYVAATRAQDYLLVSGQVTLGGNGWTARGWLRQLLDAFDLPNFGRNPNHRHAFAGDEIAVRMPSAPPSNNELLGSARFADDLWDFPAETDGFPPFEPPLIRPVNATNTAASRHITATQIAWLGTWRNGATRQQRHAYGLRFRESALHDIPSGAHDSSLGKADISPVSLGHIVHELLQYGSFALEDARTDDMIRSIAWGRGLTSAAELAAVRHQVGTLLEQYEVSEVNQWIKSTRADGRAIFTEMPFIFRTEKRVIHGVMDLLLQDAQGEWVVVDYKSSTVARADYASDARRYRLQLGVYASAIKAQFGLENFPRTFVHYLQGNRTVQLDSDDCLAELERLESTIGELVAFDA